MIGIFAALGRELKPIKACLLNIEEFRDSGVLFSVGRMKRADIVLVQTGIGWQRASSAARLAGDRFPLKVYVSTGFAGALQNSIHVGDIVIAQKILSLASPDAKVFTCDPAMTRSAETAAKGFSGTVFSGNFVTVRKIVGRSEEKKKIAAESGAVALDMETAAVAEVAEQRGMPFIAVRAVSDVLEEDIGFDAGLLLADDGTFQWRAGIRYLASNPAAWSHLNRLRRQTSLAARSLGVFFQEFLPSLNLN